jgi:hypothetical protein
MSMIKLRDPQEAIQEIKAKLIEAAETYRKDPEVSRSRGA